MTITLDLSLAEEARPRREAAAHGQDIGERAHARLSGQPQNQNAPYDPAAALAVLDSFLEQGEAEHREALAVLREALDQDRPGQRSIFGQGINPRPPA